MAKILFSVAGEGRGHAARVATMADRLKARHEVVILASHQAQEMLVGRYPDPIGRVRVRQIPGLRFEYSEQKLDLIRSTLGGLAFLAGVRRHVRNVEAIIDAEQPDLGVVDFEGLLPRAADRAGLPYISLSHQHFITAFDLSDLPARLWWKAWAMRPAIWLHHATQRETIISGFFEAPLRQCWKQLPVTVVGPLLRPEIRAARVSDRGHVLSYLRTSTPPAVFELLARLPRPVRIYGLGARPSAGNLSFHPFDEQAFVADLASSTAYLGAAGNQSLGEALHLGKPVLALPERKHFEQRINAHFIEAMGCGACCPLELATWPTFTNFFDNLETYRLSTTLRQGRMDGGPDVERRIEDHLARTVPARTMAA